MNSSSQDLGKHPCGSQPEADTGATAALATRVEGLSDSVRAHIRNIGLRPEAIQALENLPHPLDLQLLMANCHARGFREGLDASGIDLVRQMAAESVKWDRANLEAVPADYTGPGFSFGQYWRHRLAISLSWQAFCADPENSPALANLTDGAQRQDGPVHSPGMTPDLPAPTQQGADQ